MSKTSQVSCSSASLMPSSSMKLECSTEVTPARMASLMPSVPWACAATRLPQTWASYTAAFISSSVYCGSPTDSSSESTPAVARILMTSAPYLTFSRTFLRISSRFRSEEHTSELQSPDHLVCRLLLEKKKTILQNDRPLYRYHQQR